MAESNPSDGTSGLFSGLPSKAQTQVKSGLRVIARMSEDSLAKLADHVKKAVGLKHPPFEKYATLLNISRSEAVDVLSAAMATLAFISQNEISADAFGQRAVDERVIDAGDKTAVSNFVQALLDQNILLREEVERSRISTLFLPSFVSLEAIIDVRLRFKEADVQAAVPVAVVRLRTEDERAEEEAMFQVTSVGIEEIIEQLQKANHQLQAAEEWAQQISLHKEGE